MFLSKISGRSIKGGDFDVALTRANVVHGDNFAGKTRVADAMRLLLVGHLPELGKLPRATFGLASGPAMTVTGVLTDGVVDYALSRRWWLEGDTVKTEFLIPDVLKGCSLLTVMLNAEEYFALSDRDRVNYVFKNLPMDGLPTAASIVARVSGAVPGYDAAEAFKHGAALPLQENLEQAIAAVADDWKREKDHANRMEETVRGLTGLRAQDEKFRPLAEAQDERARVERKLTDAAAQKSVLMARYTEMRSARVRREAINRDLSFTEKDSRDLVDLEAKLGLLVAEADKLPVAILPLMEYATRVAEADAAHKRAYQSVRDAEAELKQANQSLASLDGLNNCPYCGACGDSWKTALAADLGAAVGKWEMEITTRTAVMGHARTAADAAIAERDGAKVVIAKAEEIRAQGDACRQRIAAIKPRLARADALREELGRLAPDDNELTVQVDMLQAEENIRRAEARTLDEEISLAQGRQQELRRLAEAEAERDDAKKKQGLAAEAGKELRLVQAELVEEAFRPLLDRANAIFGAVLRTPLAYRDGEIGTRRGGVWVGHRTFSGAEKALAYAAIQAALASRSPVRLMLLDELGRLTVSTAELVALAVANAIEAGHVDQFLGIDPERPLLYNPPGKKQAFNLIKAD